jgi:hypothetical protein
MNKKMVIFLKLFALKKKEMIKKNINIKMEINVQRNFMNKENQHEQHDH